MMSVQIINLNHSMNASFQRGIIAIIGPNGCGKSTLLRIISGLQAPLVGQILIQRHDIYRFAQKIKPLLGYVAATPFLYPHLTLLENLLFLAKLKKIPPSLVHEKIHKVLHLCHLIDYQKILFNQLSDGFKKRACIASQLLHAPTYLFLDEPCTGLDPAQRENLWHLFKNLRSVGVGILFSSHHVQEIEKHCDEIYVLSQKTLTLLDPFDHGAVHYDFDNSSTGTI